jgi:transcriptional regulator with XRE-family HTH domain
MTTKLQAAADRRASAVRHQLAMDIRRLREDAGVSRAAVARMAGIHHSLVGRLEDGAYLPSIETYARVCAALGADLHTRAYPTTGPVIRDRFQAPTAELLFGVCHARWERTPEVRVVRPARGWVDAVLHDRLQRLLVAAELESDLRRLEQLLRWSEEKALSLPSARAWPSWSATGDPSISRLLVVRWTRANRTVADGARRLLREAYPADPRDALDALTTGASAWPGAALLWARLGPPSPRLDAVP